MPRVRRSLSLAILALLTLAAPAFAGAPIREKVVVDDHFVDAFLSEACGAEVTVSVTGHFIIRTFTDASGAPQREVNTFALTNTYTSAHGSIRAKDVGADRVTYLPDGSVIRVIIGSVQSFNVPGEGRVYQDTGQITIQISFDADGNPIVDVLDDTKGQHDPDQLAPLCSVLGG